MKLIYRESALSDLKKIYTRICMQDRRAAATVVRQLHGSIEHLALHPQLGRRGSVPGTMELVIPGLPYIAIYTTTEEAIVIVAVFHSAQDRRSAA